MPMLCFPLTSLSLAALTLLPLGARGLLLETLTRRAGLSGKMSVLLDCAESDEGILKPFSSPIADLQVSPDLPFVARPLLSIHAVC